MTGWNMPPGVNENMIPGNRPEDVANERFWSEFEDKLEERGIDVPDGSQEFIQEPVDAWNSTWFVEAVVLARDMGYNLGYAQGEGDATMADVYSDMEIDDKIQEAVRMLSDRLHGIITEVRKNNDNER
jgi:hypothetical protein